MRTTVGPLPSAVYWRRRAAVLGVVLLAVLITYVSCSGGDDPQRPGAGPGVVGPGTPASPPGSGAPTTEPSFEDAVPGSDPSRPAPDEVTGGGATADPGSPGVVPGAGSGTGTGPGTAAPGPGVGAGPGADVAATAAGQCTDAEMAVTPVPAQAAARRGAPIDIRLKIRNTSARTCARDVGADLQEIYIKQGARKVWSSDTCGTAKGSTILQFATNYEAEYGVTWNGRESSRCSDGLAVGPTPGPGTYEVFARLGGKISQPIPLTLS